MNLSNRPTTHDIIVIGAGPAGISAALTANAQGLRVLLLDEQTRPGGQIYRHITAISPAHAARLGPDYQHGSSLTQRLSASGVEVQYGALVWAVESDLTVTVQQKGSSFQARAPQLIAATGAIERPSPLPGWTLPGVMYAGAAQVLLKTAGSVPSGPIVLIGGGPLLLLVACQLLDAGAHVAALVETSAPRNRWDAIRHLGGALKAPSYLLKGMGLLLRLRRSGVPMFKGATDVRIEGQECARAVVFLGRGKKHRIASDTVLLHHGVLPNTQLSRFMRVQHRWDEQQLAWHPVLDDGYQTSLAGFRIPGDGAAIAGALAAEASGALAAVAAMEAIDHIDSVEAAALAAPWRVQLLRHQHIRAFLDALYRPPPWLYAPSDDTVVCRCEEVTAGRIREMAHLGCQGPNQTKFFSRCGMGPCQGRQCAITVSQILATTLDKPMQDIGSYRIRAPLKPIPLESVAALADPPDLTQHKDVA